MEPTLIAVREALADYIRTEGCNCCRGQDHDKHAERLALLLNVESFSDGSGYDFHKYCSPKRKLTKNVGL